MREIETDTNYIGYQSLTLLSELLWKELDQKGREAFLGGYYEKIGFYTKTWRTVELRYLLAFLEYLNPEFQYTGKLDIGKPIITDEHAFRKILGGDGALLEQLERTTPPTFIKYGLLTGNMEKPEVPEG